jgi:hypothetical protein
MYYGQQQWPLCHDCPASGENGWGRQGEAAADLLLASAW